MDTVTQLIEKGRAGYPAIYLLTSEEARSATDIQSAAQELKRKPYFWTFGRGLVDASGGKVDRPPIEETETPPGVLAHFKNLESSSIVVLRHFHHFLEDPALQSFLLTLIPGLKISKSMILITSPISPSVNRPGGGPMLPRELEKEFALVETGYPGPQMLGKTLGGIVANIKDKAKHPDPSTTEKLIEAAQGLTTTEAENAFALAIIRPQMEGRTGWDPKVVMDEKCAAIKKTGLLEYIPVKEGLSQVGGMKELKTWIGKRRKAFSKEARDFGLSTPKGLLMVGPPGSGKSLGAKALSGELGLPLLRCDVGALLGGLVGQSEENSRRAIALAEAVAPCILWLDEIEKGFSGSMNGLDSGVGARVLGTFLTWMQEKTSPVFVYSTSNNVAALPPELLRKGRFDEIFSVLLPSKRERKEIFEIHVKKKGREKLLPKLMLDSLVVKSEGYSGAEIEAAVNEALFAAFAEGHDLNTLDIQEALEASVPLSRTMKAQINAMIDWCKGRTRPANAPEENEEVLSIAQGTSRVVSA